MIDALFNWFDERLGISGSGRKMLNKIFPDHWSFLIGEIALYSFIVLLGTGVFLTLYFVPSSKDVIYRGLVRAASRPAGLRGIRLDTEPELRRTRRPAHAPDAPLGGEYLRGVDRRPHAPHLLHRGFRKPRELNWIVGSTLLILAIFNGFLGYSLPDDLVSGTGIRISFSIVESIPLIGSYAAFFLFGGNFPGQLDHPEVLHPPRADPARCNRGAAQRSPRDARPPEAHAIPRTRQYAPQCRRGAVVADFCREDDRLHVPDGRGNGRPRARSSRSTPFGSMARTCRTR